jgi:hypothetical protein
MILFTRPSRFLTILCASVQLALPAALGVIDARSAWDGRNTLTHIEEPGGQQCHARHGDECILCRYLATGAARDEPAPGLVPPIAGVQPRLSAEAATPSAWRRGFHSRAPPVTLI